MKHFILSVILFFGFGFCNAQEVDSLRADLTKVFKEILDADNTQKSVADKTITELEALYFKTQKVHYSKGEEAAGTYLMKQYLRRGLYEKVIEIGSNLNENITNFHNKTTRAELCRMMALAYSNLGFQEKALDEYRKAIIYAYSVDDDDFRHYLLSIAYENITSYFEYTKQYNDSIPYYYLKSIKEAELIKDSSTRLPSNYKLNAIMYAHKDLADYYIHLSKPIQPVLAEKEIKIALNLNQNREDRIMASNKVAFLASLCRIYYLQGNYDLAIESAKNGITLEHLSPSPYDKKVFYEILTKSYLSKNDKKKSENYMELYTLTNDSIVTNEKSQMSRTLNHVVSSQKRQSTKKNGQIIVIASGIIILISTIALILWKADRKKLRKKYECLIALYNTTEIFEKKEIDLVEIDVMENYNAKNSILSDKITHISKTETSTLEPHTSNIPDTTLQKLLSKLEKFEKTNRFLKPDTNALNLANYIGTNQTYLSELLKSHRGLTYSNYINKLRIEYITEKLFENPQYQHYKITHLAYESGFASRQVFISAFKKVTGMTPSYYISQLKSDESMKEKIV